MRLKLKMKVFGLVSGLSILTLAAGQSAFAILNLDPSFGTNGVTITSFGHEAGIAGSGMALQSDGKAIAVGFASNGSNNDWAIARYNMDGTLDSSFAGNGTVVRNFGDNDALGGVAVQPDGKVVVSGYTRTAPGDAQWTVARYNADGTPDFGFGTAGLAKSFTSNSSNVLGVAVQPDGKIVAVGYSRGPGLLHDDIAVARYNADGSADVSFGSGGTVTTGLNFGGTPNDRGNSVAIQPDGKIVVFGDYDTGQNRDNVVLIRYNTDGSLDGGFGSGGIRTDNFSFNNGGRTVRLQPDGNILVAGATCINGICDTYVARYTTGGVRDSSFGANGVTVISFVSGSESANGMALQPDGKIVLAGYGQNGSVSESLVSRFNADGTLDPTFGANGLFIPSLSPDGDGLVTVLLQSDGKFLVGGGASNGSYTDWAVARITAGPISSNRPQVFILLPGINTELTREQIKNGTTPGFESVQTAITQMVPNAQFVTYSYTGFAGGGKNTKPQPYTCLNTHTNPIGVDIQVLDKQIQAILSKQPDAQVYLIGHSLGGVIAYGYMAALQAEGIVTPLANNTLSGVVTLDSPLGGVSSDPAYRDYETTFFETTCQGYSIAQDLAVRNLEAMFNSVPSAATPYGGQASVLSIPFNKKAVLPNPLPNNQTLAANAHAQNTTVLTVGNTLDRLWLPDTCDIPVTQFRHTQWLVDQGDDTGIYGRAITSSALTCQFDMLFNQGNHNDALTNPSVLQGIQQFVTGQSPSALSAAPGES